MSGIEDDNFSQLRPEVRESWLRSKAYGLRPEKSKAPRVLEDDVLTHSNPKARWLRSALQY